MGGAVAAAVDLFDDIAGAIIKRFRLMPLGIGCDDGPVEFVESDGSYLVEIVQLPSASRRWLKSDFAVEIAVAS